MNTGKLYIQLYSIPKSINYYRYVIYDTGELADYLDRTRCMFPSLFCLPSRISILRFELDDVNDDLRMILASIKRLGDSGVCRTNMHISFVLVCLRGTIYYLCVVCICTKCNVHINEDWRFLYRNVTTQIHSHLHIWHTHTHTTDYYRCAFTRTGVTFLHNHMRDDSSASNEWSRLMHYPSV